MEGAKSWLPWIKLIQIKVTMNDTHSQSLANHITLILCKQTCTILSPRLGLQHTWGQNQTMSVTIQSAIVTTSTAIIKNKQELPDLQPPSHTLALQTEYVFWQQWLERASQHRNTMLELTPARIRAAQRCNHIQHDTRKTETWTKSQLNYHMRM